MPSPLGLQLCAFHASGGRRTPTGMRDESRRTRVTSPLTPMIAMTPPKRLIILTFLFMASLASAQHCRKIDIDKSSGFCTVPDPKLIPGAMDASFACVSNIERPRSVTNAEKNAILRAYGYPVNTKKSSGEFDLWYPHWMRGLDTQDNIWFEPHAGRFGSFAKDKVELLLWKKVCVDKTMTLDQAKAAYLRGGGRNCFRNLDVTGIVCCAATSRSTVLLFRCGLRFERAHIFIATVEELLQFSR
jgi:hypothetical protein